jgi:REP element-mobilizing transposase RayT
MHAQALSAAEPAADAEPVVARSDDGDVGQAYFLTINALLRRPLFLDPDGARAVSRMQSEVSIWGCSRCLAWVLMPDRWQGLVLLDRGDSLDRLVRRFKSITARAAEPRLRINGWLWAKGFNQRALDNDQDLQAVARHLVANPVREGLAKSVGAYPYWNAVWLDRPRDCPGA